MTPEQIETMTGILDGREFMYATTRYKFEAASHSLVLDDRGKWVESEITTGEFLSLLANNEIALVPQPPEPLSDEMGELLDLEDMVHTLFVQSCDVLEQQRLFDRFDGVTEKGKYLLGQWLMEKNKEAANV